MLRRRRRNIRDTLALTADDRCLNIMPLFHIHGLIAALLAPLAAGGQRLLHAGLQRAAVLRLARRGEADLVHGGADHAPGDPRARRAQRRGRSRATGCASSAPRRRRCRRR